MIDIQSKEYDSAAKGWHVHAVADLKSGTRSGLHFVPLLSKATEEDLQEAIRLMYEPE
jgi:hypothetical protein